MSDAFETSSVQAKYDAYSSLASPYATSELTGYSFLSSGSDLATAIDELKSHALRRATAVENHLAAPQVDGIGYRFALLEHREVSMEP